MTALKRSKPHPPHTGSTFHRQLQPLYTRKNTRFRARASSPKQSARNIHAAITMRFASTRGKHQRRTDYALKRSKPHPPHTGGTFHRPLQPLDTEKHKVSCSGFLPKTKPMQPFQFVLQQHVHIHSLQCDLHPRVAEHQGRTVIK